MKENQKGFSVIEGLLVVIIVGLLGGIGWYVWDSNKKTNQYLDNASSNKIQTQTSGKDKKDTSKPDETSGWKLVESIGGAYTIRIPDGWEIINYPGNTVNSDKITYVEGTPAIVTQAGAEHAGHQKKFNITFSQGSSDGPQWESPNQYGRETSEDFSLGSLKGKKYTIEWTQSVTGVNKGDKIYQYSVNLTGNKLLDIVYMKGSSEADNLKYVELAIKTITLK